jgi:hypothetical protein
MTYHIVLIIHLSIIVPYHTSYHTYHTITQWYYRIIIDTHHNIIVSSRYVIMLIIA